MTRMATNKILEMIEIGLLDKDYVINACLKYMSEDDVRDMAHCNDIDLDDDTIEEEDEESPDTLWYDTSDELL